MRRLSSRKGAQIPADRADSFGFTPFPCPFPEVMCFPETHTRLGGVSLQPGKQGKAEPADTHLNQTKREARWPHTHAQLPGGQRTRQQESSGQMGTGHFRVTALSQQITLGHTTLFTGPATDFLMVFPEATIFVVPLSNPLIHLFTTNQTRDQKVQLGIQEMFNSQPGS